MKNFLSVFIPVLLLAATIGVFAVNHYCLIAGKNTGITSCCSKCDENCCTNDIKVFRFTFESVKQTETVLFSLFSISCILPGSLIFNSPDSIDQTVRPTIADFFCSMTGMLSTVVMRN